MSWFEHATYDKLAYDTSLVIASAITKYRNDIYETFITCEPWFRTRYAIPEVPLKFEIA